MMCAMETQSCLQVRSMPACLLQGVHGPALPCLSLTRLHIAGSQADDNAACFWWWKLSA